jgi:basic amino acid/polyamine antiporter, APA family
MLLLPDHNLQAALVSGSAGAKLARRISLFYASMLVMGGIVGAGIFINPSVVAGQMHTPALRGTAA